MGVLWEGVVAVNGEGVVVWGVARAPWPPGCPHPGTPS